jgi:hypothetical protein
MSEQQTEAQRLHGASSEDETAGEKESLTRYRD